MGPPGTVTAIRRERQAWPFAGARLHRERPDARFSLSCQTLDELTDLLDAATFRQSGVYYRRGHRDRPGVRIGAGARGSGSGDRWPAKGSSRSGGRGNYGCWWQGAGGDVRRNQRIVGGKCAIAGGKAVWAVGYDREQRG